MSAFSKGTNGARYSTLNDLHLRSIIDYQKSTLLSLIIATAYKQAIQYSLQYV